MRKSKVIYLDYAASASPNPSSIHALGVEAQDGLKNARGTTARILGSRREEIIFTSGGTEGNNLAIQGVVFTWLKKNPGETLPHVITTNIEHPSVLETCRMMEKRKLADVSIVSVEKNGIVDPKKIKKEIRPNTVLVSVMYANNEIGTIQPIKEIAREIRHYRKTKSHKLKAESYPLFHTDAVQAANYLDLNVEKLGVDLMTLTGSKIEGATLEDRQAGRVGVLYKRKSVELSPVWGGGDQEQGLRPGTENLPEILKFVEAFKRADKIKEKENKRLEKLRDYFTMKLLSVFSSVRRVSNTRNLGVGHPTELIINGDLKNRLPNNVNVTFSKIPSDLLVIELSARGIMASSKSACKSSRAEGSYVIKAVCPRTGTDIGGVRFSLGRETTKSDIDYTLKSLKEILTKLKKWYN